MGKVSVARIRVQYFAILRERAGRSSEEVETAASTAAALYAELRQRYDFPDPASLKVAVNDEFAGWQSKLTDGDRIVFIPPVAGG
jgi:molybdopterin converting factor subunit 1